LISQNAGDPKTEFCKPELTPTTLTLQNKLDRVTKTKNRNHNADFGNLILPKNNLADEMDFANQNL
jgi:hypothetical protein